MMNHVPDTDEVRGTIITTRPDGNRAGQVKGRVKVDIGKLEAVPSWIFAQIHCSMR